MTASWRDEHPAIGIDRDRFIETVSALDSLRIAAQRYEHVVDRLIEWTIPHLDVLHHTAAEYHSRGRSKVQMKVQFCLRDSDRVFWAAYPQAAKQIGAKLIVLQDNVPEFGPGARDRVRSSLSQLPGFEPVGASDQPTVGFNVLFFPPSLSRVLAILDEALASVVR